MKSYKFNPVYLKDVAIIVLFICLTGSLLRGIKEAIPEKQKVPKRIARTRVAEMKRGDEGWVKHEEIQMDSEHHLWVYSDAITSYEKSEAEINRVVKTERGYNVSVSNKYWIDSNNELDTRYYVPVDKVVMHEEPEPPKKEEEKKK